MAATMNGNTIPKANVRISDSPFRLMPLGPAIGIHSTLTPLPIGTSIENERAMPLAKKSGLLKGLVTG